MLILVAPSFGGEFPEQRRSENDPFPRPADGAVCEVNPPELVWLPLEKAVAYRVEIQSASSGAVILSQETDKNVLALADPLPPGDYLWTVTASDKNAKPLAVRRIFSFTIGENTPLFPYPHIEALIAGLKPYHPRLIFAKDKLHEFRTTLATTRANG